MRASHGLSKLTAHHVATAFDLSPFTSACHLGGTSLHPTGIGANGCKPSLVGSCRCLIYRQASQVEESASSSGDPGSIPGSGRSPGEGNGNPPQYSCLENPHGQTSPVGYSSWGCRVGQD